MSSLSVRGIEKHFGDVRALAGLDLDVASGELVVIVGPSGCGKSTALRIVAGLETPDRGTVHIGSDDVTRVEAGRRNVAMVFQNHALFPHLTVEENIGFGMRARGAGAEDVRRAVAEAAAVVGCDTLLARHPHEMSGGERQRVALARGLVRKPDLFLLDEPLSNLDAQLRFQMRRELRRLHGEIGGTMLHVTHDQVEALTLGDRIAVLADGRVQQLGTPDEVYRHPANRFVATFIGSPAMNLVPMVGDGRTLRSVSADGALVVELGDAVDPTRLSAAGVTAGLRPEHLALHAPHHQIGDGAIGAPGVVVEVEPAGNESHAQVDIGGTELTVRTDSETRPTVGDRVTVVVERRRVHVFDGAGEAVR